MEHQGQGGQRHHLVEDVQGEQVGAHGHPQGDAIAHGIKGKERFLIAVKLHILRGVQGGQGPQEGRQRREHLAHAVKVQGHHQKLVEADQVKPFHLRAEQQNAYQGGCHQRHAQHIRKARPLLEPQGWQQGARNQGQRDGGDQYHRLPFIATIRTACWPIG